MAEILVIDDQDRYAALVRRVMPEHEVHGPARSWEEARATLRRAGRRIDLVLLDVHFDIPAEQLVGLPEGADERQLDRCRRQQGVHILTRLRQGWPELPVVLMTSRDDVDLGDADDAEDTTFFLDQEALDADTLRAQVESVLSTRRGMEREGPIWWGRSLEMRRIRSQLLTLARGRLPIVLGGPTGSGKSLVARHFIHPRSQRKGAFVAVDLSTVPRDLMGAHLFGSARGSYTGSVTDRKGAFEEADGGTLFLDEIGNLSEEAQRMLLLALQEGAVTRLGDTRERKVDVKLVVATHEDLPRMVREGRFRSDLYMRLNPACTVVLPPLVDRQPDWVRLVEFCCEQALSGPYLRELVEQYVERNRLSAASLRVVEQEEEASQTPGIQLLLPRRTVQLLRQHPWPGNLREFAMTVENALLFTFAERAQLGRVERPDLIQLRPRLIHDMLRHADLAPAAGPADGFGVQVALKPQETLNQVAVEVERQYFLHLYQLHQGNWAEMARVLLGDAEAARKVQLRFNQLGLKVRDMKKEEG